MRKTSVYIFVNPRSENLEKELLKSLTKWSLVWSDSRNRDCATGTGVNRN
jgi:hypothetical protein